jgi:hypothetical protein
MRSGPNNLRRRGSPIDYIQVQYAPYDCRAAIGTKRTPLPNLPLRADIKHNTPVMACREKFAQGFKNSSLNAAMFFASNSHAQNECARQRGLTGRIG